MTTEQNTSESNFTDAATFTDSAPTLDIVSINKTEIFTKEECERILSECVEDLWIPSTVVGSGSIHKSRRQKLRGDLQGFPFTNIRDVTKTANDTIFDFSLLGIIDQDYPQVFNYSKDDFYNMHIELNPMAPSRKMTFIINLSDPSEYEGGEIKFLNIDTDPGILEERGTCLVFPSYLPFSISPITSGSKLIIVGHVHGALFK